jgi:hypothetical protein
MLNESELSPKQVQGAITALRVLIGIFLFLDLALAGAFIASLFQNT